VVSSTPRLLYPRERAPGTHCIGGWVDPRAGLDDMEKWKLLTLPGLELRALSRPARSQSLYRLQPVSKMLESLRKYHWNCWRSAISWQLWEPRLLHGVVWNQLLAAITCLPPRPERKCVLRCHELNMLYRLPQKQNRHYPVAFGHNLFLTPQIGSRKPLPRNLVCVVIASREGNNAKRKRAK
jgi:hypothetical protein